MGILFLHTGALLYRKHGSELAVIEVLTSHGSALEKLAVHLHALVLHVIERGRL